MKLLFVSPIVSRRYASDWDGVCRRLEYTVRSLTRQTCPDWKMLVVGQEKPRLPEDLDRHVLFCEADLDIDDPQSQGRREIDKERKLHCGFVAMKELNPEYVMPLDYDDLVSVRLGQYVAEHPSADAFILRRGYVYVDGDDHCRYSSRICMRTGSNTVVRYAAAKHLFPSERVTFSPPPPSYRDWPFVTSHNKHPEKLLPSLGLSWTTIPFPAVIWRRNSSSISNAYASSRVTSRRPPVSRLVDSCRETVKAVVLRRRITPALQREFGGENVGFGVASAPAPAS